MAVYIVECNCGAETCRGSFRVTHSSNGRVPVSITAVQNADGVSTQLLLTAEKAMELACALMNMVAELSIVERED